MTEWYKSRRGLENVSTNLKIKEITNVPSSVRFVVQTALGIPGRSELTDSSTSKPWRRVLNVLREPRPHAANICGVSEFGRRFITFESRIGSNDTSSSATTKFSKGLGRKKAWGRGILGSAIPNDGYKVELYSGSLSSSPSFWNW